MPSKPEVDPEHLEEFRAHARKRTLAFLAHAVSPTANKNEARNAAMKACKLIDEFKLLDEREGASVLETIQKVRDAAADPNVQATVAAVGDAAKAGLDLFGKLANLTARRR